MGVPRAVVKVGMKNATCLLQLLAVVLNSSCRGQNVNCTTGDLRLYNSSAVGQGMVQQCDSSNQWSAVCNFGWNCADAVVACRQMGFDESRPNIFPDGYFGKWDRLLDFHYICSGTENSLQDCGTAGSSNCLINNYPNRMAGLACHMHLGECAHGDLRLVGGESESEGRVEVCYQGGWYSVCGIEDEEASVMCKQLGHTEYPVASVFIDGRFGQTPTSQGYVEFECSEQFLEEMWSECTISPPSCVNCNGDAIKCFIPPECEERSLRLVDGNIENEGRVEVCLQGVWGTVCSQPDWDSIDAYVACKQLNLGSSGLAPITYTNASLFGDGNQPHGVFAPRCSGWENALTECSYTPYGSFSCSREYTAAILCFDGCDDGEARLVGGASDSEGTVEVCLGNLWGLVAESGWSLADAQVVCHQLGFPLDEVQAVKNSFYGKPRKPVHLKNVHCTGQEQQVLFCTYIEFSSLEEKKEILSQVEVAGVLCLNQTGNQANTTSGQNCTRELTSSTVLLVPTYLTAMLLLASLLLFLVGWIVYRKRKHSTGAEVIYWKRKFTNGTNSSSFKRKRPLPKVEPPKGHGPFEITNWTNNPLVPGSLACVQAASGAKVIEKENEYIDAIYESTEPADEYTELS